MCVLCVFPPKKLYLVLVVIRIVYNSVCCNFGRQSVSVFDKMHLHALFQGARDILQNFSRLSCHTSTKSYCAFPLPLTTYGYMECNMHWMSNGASWAATWLT